MTVSVAALAGCDAGLGYGADFGYPDKPPTPPGATVAATAKGWDNDDPMRGREIVIDIGNAPPATLVEFYQDQFPSDQGWLEGTPDPDVGGGHVLCLVSHAADGFDEYVEIYPYDYDGRKFESAGPHRYRASVSRLYVRSETGQRGVDRCGLAGNWFPTHL